MLQYKVSNPRPLYYITSGGTTSLPVCYLSSCTIEILLFTVATDYRSNFAKTILFENCSCFSEIPFSISVESPRIFQCLISIPVRQIDGKSSAIYLADSFCQHYSTANRRRSTWPILFVSITSTEVVYRPRSQSPLHFDIRNI